MSSRAISYQAPTRNVLNGYDLLAKSFPGMALLVGLSSLLPKVENSGLNDFGIPQFATFLIIVILLGLLIGEAVHTMAESIEKFIFVPVRITRSAYRGTYSWITNIISRVPKSSEKRQQHIDSGIIGRIKILLYWYLNLSFKQHRELFINIVESNYGNFFGTWQFMERGELVDRFSDSIESTYNVNIEDSPEDLSFLYPSIMSRIYMSEARLSKRFQIVYAFCRSMWMTFSLITIGYVYVVMAGTPGQINVPFGGEYVPVGVAMLQSNPLPLSIVPFLTGLTTVGFLAASGKYKYHYIEYIIADFPFVIEFDDEESPQTRINDWQQGGSR